VDRDPSPILIVIGILLLLLGVVAAFMGPLEIYCFYLFSEGGPFHYEGFGFGSLMFGNIATQIIGYYVIALLLIPLGYGHLKLRRWIRPVSLALLRCWLVLGIPLAVMFLLVLVTGKELTLTAILVVLVLVAVSYPVVPGLLIRFYHSTGVKQTLESREPKPAWIEQSPIPILTLCILYLFYAVVWHVPILFSGLFPLFGTLLFEIPGIVASDLSILLLVWLTWGTIRERIWAWWVALIYFSLLAISLVLTFATTSFSEILTGMRFPPAEMEALQNVPVEGVHLAAFLGFPLLLTTIAIARSKRSFSGRRSED
jgi:hypothetical protein